MRLVEQSKSARRVVRLVREFHGRSPHWLILEGPVEQVSVLLATDTRLTDVAEASTVMLLGLLGWRGSVVRSSSLDVRPERSERLADLTRAVGPSEYLCGTGGAKYLDARPFSEQRIRVRYFQPPEISGLDRKASSLYQLANLGAVSLDETRSGSGPTKAVAGSR